jgi:hypothetical protein
MFGCIQKEHELKLNFKWFQDIEKHSGVKGQNANDILGLIKKMLTAPWLSDIHRLGQVSVNRKCRQWRVLKADSHKIS